MIKMNDSENMRLCENKVNILKEALACAEAELQSLKDERSRQDAIERICKGNKYLHSKATRQLAIFFREKGFLITGIQETDAVCKVRYGLAKNIFDYRKSLIPFCRFIYDRKVESYSIAGLPVEDKTAICNFCTALKNLKWLDWRKEKDALHIERKMPKEQYVFFNGGWAEDAVRYLIEKTLLELKIKRRAVFRDVKIELLNVERGRGIHQFDFIVAFRDRIYIFEVKTGTTIGVERWIDHARLFNDSHGKDRFLMCCNDDSVDSRIFRPYRLFHLSSLQKEFGEYLKREFPDAKQ